MTISRRYFLKNGGVAMLGMAALPSFLQRAVANTPTPNQKKMVVLFQRGAMDGLNVVVPFGEPNYYRIRPSIAIPQPRQGSTDATLDLDGFFGLHPSLAPMLPLFRNGQLAIVQAVGSPDPTRSHFDAQDFMESGTPGRKATDDGWLNRALQTMPEQKPSPFRAVAFGPYLPRTLQGSASAIAIPDLKQFKMNGPQQTTEGGFEAMYAQTIDRALRGVGTETFEAAFGSLLRAVHFELFQVGDGDGGGASLKGARKIRAEGDSAKRRRFFFGHGLQGAIEPAVVGGFAAGSSRFHEILRVEVGARGIGRADGLDDGELSVAEKRKHGGQAGMQTEEAVEIERGISAALAGVRDRDGGAHAIVIRFAEGDDYVEAVHGATLEEDHHFLFIGRGGADYGALQEGWECGHAEHGDAAVF